MNNNKGLELGVGVFLLIGIVCLGYLSLYLGDVKFFDRSSYLVNADFSNVSGLTKGAPVTIAGVEVGSVDDIHYKDGTAAVTLRINKDVKLEDDVIAAVKTSGIIGEKYIAISLGASDAYIKPGGRIRDTQPPLDLEELVGKFMFGGVGNK